MQEPIFYTMKEFGLYTIKQKYIDEFSKIDDGLLSLKNNRPFICIKVTEEKRNWLVPVASIDPSKSDYQSKNNKYKDFVAADKKQAGIDKNMYARAIHIVKDITGLHSDPNFLSVIEYFNVIPIKHKYCKKYRDDKKQHIVVTDRKLKEAIKKATIVNIKAAKREKFIGFLKAKINEGFINFKNYPKKCMEIGKALYKDHIALLKAEKEEKERAERQKAEAARKRELKDTVKDKAPPLSDKIEIAPQRIVGRTENGDVQIKIPGKNPEDVKTKVTLPKDNVVLDKNGENVVGITLALQKQFNFKLPGGQVRILK